MGKIQCYVFYVYYKIVFFNYLVILAGSVDWFGSADIHLYDQIDFVVRKSIFVSREPKI